MIRPIATVFAGTLGSRLTGFVRDALIAALLGATFVADGFLFAFQLVNVARRFLSEGALNAALVPAYARIRIDAGEVAAAAFAGRALGTVGLAVAGLALLLGIAAPHAVALLAPGFEGEPSFQAAVDTARLMLPYLAFAGPVAVMAGALNARGRVALTSFSPVLFNLVTITAVAALLIASDLGTATAGLVLAGAVGAVGILQLGFLGVSGTRLATPVRLSLDHETRALVCRALPGMIAQSGPQLLLVAGAITASASPAAVSWIYFASRLVELPLGLVGSATGAVLIPELSSAPPNGQGRTQFAASSAALQLTVGFALPASVGLGLLATPIVALLFERGAFTADDTLATALALTILATALPALALTKPLGAIFFAREEMRQPMLATLAGLGTTIVVAELTHQNFGYAAVAAAISIGAWLIAIWLVIVLAARRELPVDHRAIRNLAFIVLATAIMEIALAYALPFFAPGDGFWLRLCALGALIAFAMFVYVACLRLLGVVNFRVIRRAI